MRGREHADTRGAGRGGGEGGANACSGSGYWVGAGAGVGVLLLGGAAMLKAFTRGSAGGLRIHSCRVRDRT